MDKPIGDNTMKQEYFTIVRTDRNLFAVKTITTDGKKIISETTSDPTYQQIAFDELRRKMAMTYLKAVEENVVS